MSCVPNGRFVNILENNRHQKKVSRYITEVLAKKKKNHRQTISFKKLKNKMANLDIIHVCKKKEINKNKTK